MKRTICVVTGTRAEYGLLKPLIDELQKKSSVQLRVIATGMHLSPEFGLTYREIENDGVRIDDRVEILLSSDTPIGISKSIGLGVISFAEAFERNRPDLVIGLGDRFELFAAVIAAMVARIPVAHLHGGEATEGLIDEAIRHSITKMSHLHFTSTEEYRKRVIQLGEAPDRVFNVGAIGIDSVKNMTLIPRGKLEKLLGVKFVPPTLLVTFHPVTLENRSSEAQFVEVLKAFDELAHLKLIFTKPNSDTYGRIISKLIDEFVLKNPDRAKAFVSLGHLKYLSVLKCVGGIVGNSSSGIIEAPSFKKGTVNIGDRQRGRVIANSVINCSPTKKEIVEAIKTLLTHEFQEKLERVENPYGQGDTSKKIAQIVYTYPLEGIIKKKFYTVSSKDENIFHWHG